MSETGRTVRDGLIVGMIGYASVAALYATFDLIAGRGVLYTVDLLGKSVFKGFRDPSVLGLPIDPDLTAIFWYNALHLLASLTIGLIVTGLVTKAEHDPSQARAMMAIIVAGCVVTILTIGMLTTPIRALLPWWSIVVANSLAVLLAGSYLLWRSPAPGPKLNPFGGPRLFVR